MGGKNKLDYFEWKLEANQIYICFKTTFYKDWVSKLNICSIIALAFVYTNS